MVHDRPALCDPLLFWARERWVRFFSFDARGHLDETPCRATFLWGVGSGLKEDLVQLSFGILLAVVLAVG